MIRIYVVAIDEYYEQDYIEMVGHLPQCRKEKILRFKHKEDQLLSLFGDVLLRFGLTNLFAYKGAINLCYGEFKKPYLDVEGAYFNISHSGKYVVCAVGDSEIGIDIQKEIVSDEEEQIQLCKQFFTEKELQSLQSSKNKRDYFHKLWTLKESYIKYLGTGMYCGLDTFEFDVKRGKIECMDMKGNPIRNYFECGDFVDGYKIGICTNENVQLHECQFIDKNTLDDYLREISWLGGKENT